MNHGDQSAENQFLCMCVSHSLNVEEKKRFLIVWLMLCIMDTPHLLSVTHVCIRHLVDFF